MAWNEPGGGGRDDDPWGGRRGDQGPPDLDEALRSLQKQLAGIFGQSGSGGGGSDNNGGVGRFLSTTTLAVGAAVLVAIWGLMGFYVVDQQEQGVVFRFGEVQSNLQPAGLRWNPPLVDEVVLVNVTQVRSAEHQALMLTEDENIVDVTMTVQYLVDDPLNFVVNVRDPESSLHQAMESALRHVIGSSTMDDAITEGRAQIAAEVEDRLQNYVNIYGTGILVQKVNIDESGPPSQVQEAFDDVQKAKEDEVRFRNEANAYAEAIIPEARGRAQRQIEEANAYRDRVIARAEGEANRFSKLLAEYSLAEEVTRERLYIDTMQEVMQNSSKVLIDVEGGNNLLYLPLDKIVSQNRGSGAELPSVNTGNVRELAGEIARELSSRSTAPRRRETSR